MIVWQPGIKLEQWERMAIEAELRYHGGNKTHTAKALDIAIRTLDNKLAKYKDDDVGISEILPLQQGLASPKKEATK